MRLPAVWLAAALAGGIVLSEKLPRPLYAWWVAAAATLALGGLLLWRRWMRSAWVAALLAWCALGGAARAVERASILPTNAARMITEGRLDASGPLRWRGRLREDPLAFPWGRRYDLAIEEVESTGKPYHATGGLRLSLYKGTEAGAPEDVRAGDRVEALVRARVPRNFLDPGAFDHRGYLERQGIDLTASLRSGVLLELLSRPQPTLLERLARARANLLGRVDALFPDHPERAAVLRAMLLGDRSFVDSDVVTAFQKTAAYHILVIAGLHVGALAAFFFWLGRRLRLPLLALSVITLAALVAYVAIVQDRPPILRAAVLAGMAVCSMLLFRRVDFLNTVALAAMALLVWKPSWLTDSSFQLSFLAVSVIAGLALPWLERTSEAYLRGLRHLGDVTRDQAHPPRVTQFRIEVRASANWIAARMPRRAARYAGALVSGPLRVGLRLWEIVLLSVVIQWGMLPLLARDFHRVSLSGPLSNIPAVILTSLIVPLGFLTLLATFLSAPAAFLLGRVLGVATGWLLTTVNWFARWQRLSYRIPGSPAWLLLAFFGALVCLAVAARRAARKRSATVHARRQLPPPIHAAEWAAAFALTAMTIPVATYPFAPATERGKLEVSVLDVGQGDSIFLAFPDGRTMLVDGGGQFSLERAGGHGSRLDIGEQVVSPYLWSRGLKRLDIVALTHAHHDHLDGLRVVLDNFRVGQLWIGRSEETPAFEALLAEARSRGIPVVHEIRGASFDFGGARLGVLWPQDAIAVPQPSNEDCLVLRLADGQVGFLLTADIEKNVEAELLNEHAALAADFLKIPHHGSKTSSSAAFLEAVTPRFAVVSVGEANPFGHPAEEVIERYQQSGVRLFRTDRDGAVTALTDGRTMRVHAFAEAQPR